MPLPVLQGAAARSADDLVRFYYRTEVQWTRHLADESPLEIGTAFVNSALPHVGEANRVLDAAVPAGESTDRLIDAAEAFFVEQGSRCAGWIVNDRLTLHHALVERGYRQHEIEVMHLAGGVAPAPKDPSDLTIIPARASFRHARALGCAAAEERGEPQRAEADLLHLDDSHYDALLALRHGEAVGRVGVLAAGDVGRLDELFVVPAQRGRGIGRALLSRAIEICARSRFRHVLFAVNEDTSDAGRVLVARTGFKPIGKLAAYRRPTVPHSPPT